MKIRTYRGYKLFLGEQVDIYSDLERIDTVSSMAEATQLIDSWLAAP